MEMKPEYNYGTFPKYRISLLSSGIHQDNIEAVLEVIKPFRWIAPEEFADCTRQKRIAFEYLHESKEFIEDFAEQFRAAGATVEINPVFIPILFSLDDVYARTALYLHSLSGDRSRSEERITDYATFKLRMNSNSAASLGEFALAHWVAANNIPEAYRFLHLPSFSPYQSIRIWRDTAVHLIYKSGAGESVPPLPVEEKSWQLSEAAWLSIRNFMHRHFWTEDAWYIIPAHRMVTDGSRLLFEGWHDGKYRIIEDHNPFNAESFSMQAYYLFKSLIENS
jgi:hypothetical protein